MVGALEVPEHMMDGSINRANSNEILIHIIPSEQPPPNTLIKPSKLNRIEVVRGMA